MKWGGLVSLSDLTLYLKLQYFPINIYLLFLIRHAGSNPLYIKTNLIISSNVNLILMYTYNMSSVPRVRRNIDSLKTLNLGLKIKSEPQLLQLTFRWQHNMIQALSNLFMQTFLIVSLLLNQLVTQFSSWGQVNFVPELVNF